MPLRFRASLIRQRNLRLEKKHHVKLAMLGKQYSVKPGKIRGAHLNESRRKLSFLLVPYL